MNHTAFGMTSQLVTRINDYPLWWVLVSVAVGLLVPSVTVLTVLSTLTLAVRRAVPANKPPDDRFER